ncbi:MAG: choloylglycine hydrolase [Oscillospiraceae bacterium]|nr:choloylglycine hydrolase [Oscillospiraceae bacterium]
MCTAATYTTDSLYFGRTLDYEFSYGDAVTVMPRNYPVKFRHLPEMTGHFALIGMACSAFEYPLFYDAMNEKGLCMAGLNFVKSADYKEPLSDKVNIAQFEFIPYILGQCATVKEAREKLADINITSDQYAPDLPAAKLHWIIADKEEAVTVESVKEGVKIYDNPVGVLANEPAFDIQMFNLNNYMSLSPKNPENSFSDRLSLNAYSRGMGGMGLPGDLSSMSRFVRAAYTKMNSLSGSSENESVSQFFHILNSVDQQRGCCMVDEGKYEITLYTSCCSADKGIYYYTTYENHQITAVDMNREDLDGRVPVKYPLITGEQIKIQNAG